MKILCLSDSHFDAYGGDVTDDGSSKRLLDVVQAHDEALRIAQEAGCEAIVHGGDLFHSRKGVKPEALHRCGDWLDRVFASGISFHVIVGNHDMSLLGNTHSLAAIRHASVYGTRSRAEIGGAVFAMLPYMETSEEVAAAAKWAKRENADVLLAHVGIGDPKYADAVPVDYEVPGRVKIDDFRPDDFSAVLLGHYHKPQDLTDTVRYIGSPLQLTVKEAGHAKRFLIYDTVRRSLKSILNTVSPRYRIVHRADEIAAGAESDIVVVRPKTKDEERLALSIAESTGRSVRVEAAAPEAVAARIDASLPEHRLIEEYVGATNDDPERRERLIRTGQELLARG